MIFDVELHCDKWKDCKTKWCNGDGGFWCNEDCKLLQVNDNTVGVACWEQYLKHIDKKAGEQSD